MVVDGVYSIEAKAQEQVDLLTRSHPGKGRAAIVRLGDGGDAGAPPYAVVIGTCETEAEAEEMVVARGRRFSVWRRKVPVDVPCPRPARYTVTEVDSIQRTGPGHYLVQTRRSTAQSLPTTLNRVETRSHGHRLVAVSARIDTPGAREVFAEAQERRSFVISKYGHRVFLWSDDGRLVDWVNEWSAVMCSRQKISVHDDGVTVDLDCEEPCPPAKALGRPAMGPQTTYVQRTKEDSVPFEVDSCRWPVLVDQGGLTQLCKYSQDRWGALRKHVTYRYAAGNGELEVSMRVEYQDDPSMCSTK